MAVPAMIGRSRELIGRDSEVRRLAAIVDHLGDAVAALVIRGEPGVGKLALLLQLRERAQAVGFRGLTTAGVEAEAELPFAGLHQLLHPIEGSIGALPPAQRRSLEAALGITAEADPDPFRVALADPIVRAQLLAEAAGNPLALVELGRTVPLSRHAPGGVEAAPPSLNARLQQAFATRLFGLPETTRFAPQGGAAFGDAAQRRGGLTRNAGILREVTGKKRNRFFFFFFADYIALFPEAEERS